MTRGVVSVLVQELLAQELIYEGATGEAERGRKPTFLHIRTRNRLAVAVDVRFSKSYLIAPTLGWRGVDIRDKLAAATGLPVQVENAGRACSLAQLWLERGELTGHNSFIYVNISDGVAVGMVANGELVRGHDHIAGEFGHMPLNLDGPRCMCGASGCWEAYISNLATLSRYFGWDLSKLSPNSLRDAEHSSFTVIDLVARARSGDAKAIAAIQATARFLGLGLATIVNVINPDCIYMAGEISTAWDIIEIKEYPRLRGAAALIAAPTFAAPRVA